jgi:tetratricopeptide (TPR) repeat protein
MVAEWSRAAPAARGDFLATSPALIAGAAQLAERFGPELAADMRTFIAESLAADARRRDAQRRRQRITLTATAAGLVVALALASLAGWQWQVAKVQRERAEGNLTAATETANRLMNQLAYEFRDRAGMPADLMLEILGHARDLQKVLAERGEATPKLRRDEAAALAIMADTLRVRGATSEGLELAEQCRAIMESMTAGDPGNHSLQLALAYCDQVLGDLLLAAGRREEALAAFDKILAILQPNPDPDSQNQLAGAYDRIANLLAVAGQREQALETFRKAVAIREKRTAGNPGTRDTISRFPTTGSATCSLLRDCSKMP